MYVLALTFEFHHTIQFKPLREGEHLDNGFVSFLTCWDALQLKRNYGLTAGRGLHKDPIIRGWWSEHAAHDQERQWRWKVIKVTRRVEPCKLHSQLATTPPLDFSLFYYPLSSFLSPFSFHFLSHPAAAFLSVTPPPPPLALGYLPLNSCLAFFSVCPSFPQTMAFFFASPSITHCLLECSHYLLCAKAVNKWITAPLNLVPNAHTHTLLKESELNQLYLKLLFYSAPVYGACLKCHVAQVQRKHLRFSAWIIY